MTPEEAIKILRDVHDKALFSLRNALEILVPELKESEDERVRKELYAVINDLILPDDQKARFNGWLEKQKEQKPVEWSEEDKKMLEVCSQYIGNTIPADYDEEEFTVKDCRNWLKSLPERFNLQPKQEWSEEDEAIYNAFICEVVNEKMSPTVGQVKWFSGIRDRLKSLRPQPKQEWSEEDEEKMNSISEIIEHCVIIPYSGGKLTVSKEYKNELQCFLKSLRPSWKPSEEQIYSLGTVVNGMGESASGVSKNLRDLYEQLKKL